MYPQMHRCHASSVFHKYTNEANFAAFYHNLAQLFDLKITCQRMAAFN